MSTLKLKSIKKTYDNKVTVLHGIDLEVAHGEFVVFVGPSGCGKSTLLRCIAGLEDITDGELQIDGKPMNTVPPAERGLAMVFQNYALYPHMTVAENMSFALKMAKTSPAEIAHAVQTAAQVLHITPLLAHFPAQLSGGQRQRVAIGRAIVRRPGVFLFDEPLSNLDASLRTEMRVEIARLHATLGATIIYVTHDQAEAMTLADRIVIFNAGRIEQSGPPLALYRKPANLFVARFLGSPAINLFEGTVLDLDASKLRVDLGVDGVVELPQRTCQLPVGSRVTLGLRPEQFTEAQEVAQGAHSLRCDVQLLEHLGDVAFVHVHTQSGKRLCVRVAPETVLAKGSALHLNFEAREVLVFDDAGTAHHEHFAQ